ncbi:MAG: NigD-like N-terminal domain-containing protein [Bacteroidales bacterium]|nr:NigD-like N-terminal domain-containing protein [Bacteroidales bacterium]
MKRYKFIILLMLPGLLMLSCSKETEQTPNYYSALGNVKESNDSIILESDSGKRLYISSYNRQYKIEDGDRILAYFTIVEQTLPVGIDNIIDIYYHEKILLKPVVEYTASNSDSLGYDLIEIRAIGVSKDYLNLNFNFMWAYKQHSINLARPAGEIPSDTIDLEIRHNRNDDALLNWTEAIVSFDLSSLKNELADSVVLRVKANDYYNSKYEKFLTYKY